MAFSIILRDSIAEFMAKLGQKDPWSLLAEAFSFHSCRPTNQKN